MKPKILVLLLSFVWVSCSVSILFAEDYTRFVNPYIGTGGHGHVFLGANVPYGAVQLGPSNFFRGWDWCSGYHYSDDVVLGFAHTHLSGTGIPDLGEVVLMPFSGKFKPTPGDLDDSENGYATNYTHDKETVRPGYYGVELSEYGINVELTATERVGVHRYKFSDNGQTHVAIDLHHEHGGGRPLKSSMRQVDERTIVGTRLSTGWAQDRRIYFALQASKNLGTLSVYEGDKKLSDAAGSGVGVRGFVTFEKSPGELVLKVGISSVSEENALANIAAEVSHWDFDQVAAEAKQKWNEGLQKIAIETEDKSQQRIFYTALYHSMFAPVLYNDHNGDYRGTDKEVHRGADHTNYSILSLWDTYRAAHPLYTITQPGRVNDFINSMLAIYDQQGKLPVWHLLGNETETMIGYHAVPVIVDAYFKGFRGFDVEKAYEAVKGSAMLDHEGLDHLKKYGYIPAELEVESVAKAMEYAIDDWCIAAMAKSLGKEDDFEYFAERSKYYAKYFDAETGFMRGKLADGSWREPFDPIASKHREDDYCEGNGWQYIWLVPHDPQGLIDLFGSEQAFIEKLDKMFVTEFIRGENASVDITGLIGQYAHGNEPGHHTTYLYAYAGQQWKTAEKIREITTTLYADDPDGLSGNEDCGQMSSWYVLSSMGMYPVNPAAGVYVFGSPLFDRATIQLDGGKSFTISAVNNSKENLYIQSVKLNGQSYNKTYIKHGDLMAGGELEFQMGSAPNKSFGSAKDSRPSTTFDQVPVMEN